MLLVANKVDLVHLRKVTEKEGRAMANRLNLLYMETSAKDPPQNIDGAFHEVTVYFCVQYTIIIYSIVCIRWLFSFLTLRWYASYETIQKSCLKIAVVDARNVWSCKKLQNCESAFEQTNKKLSLRLLKTKKKKKECTMHSMIF